MTNADCAAFNFDINTFGLDSPLTKREYFAAMAMQGMLANTEITKDCERKQDPTVIAGAAVKYADMFIEALNK